MSGSLRNSKHSKIVKSHGVAFIGGDQTLQDLYKWQGTICSAVEPTSCVATRVTGDEPPAAGDESTCLSAMSHCWTNGALTQADVFNTTGMDPDPIFYNQNTTQSGEVVSGYAYGTPGYDAHVDSNCLSEKNQDYCVNPFANGHSGPPIGPSTNTGAMAADQILLALYATLACLMLGLRTYGLMKKAAHQKSTSLTEPLLPPEPSAPPKDALVTATHTHGISSSVTTPVDTNPASAPAPAVAP
ncbi:MAG: hypothetical protein EBX40_04215 [Gammaproteobacteria bacterium]|nr:hypothetical protein [Gammaproteobacteria bacterium]